MCLYKSKPRETSHTIGVVTFDHLFLFHAFGCDEIINAFILTMLTSCATFQTFPIFFLWLLFLFLATRWLQHSALLLTSCILDGLRFEITNKIKINKNIQTVCKHCCNLYIFLLINLKKTCCVCVFNISVIDFTCILVSVYMALGALNTSATANASHNIYNDKLCSLIHENTSDNSDRRDSRERPHVSVAASHHLYPICCCARSQEDAGMLVIHGSSKVVSHQQLFLLSAPFTFRRGAREREREVPWPVGGGRGL